MPELPEVETVRRGLEQDLTGALVVDADIRAKALRFPFPAGLPEKLAGRGVLNFGRRAKYILVHFDSQETLVIHLGMSGRIKIVQAEEDYEIVKHDHMILSFENGKKLVLNDPRRFGMVMLIKDSEMPQHKSFAALGPEPLDNGFSAAVLIKALMKKKTPVKSALLDQGVVAGLGNIYVCEALYHAGIDPRRIANSITEDEAERLTQMIRMVLIKAIEAGGSSLKDYRRADGELGYFQHQFAVYDREGISCPECDCDINKTGGVRRVTQAGRSSFYCPKKQK